MKRLIIASLLVLLCVAPSLAFPVYFKEQYYQLYHTHYIQYPDDSIENIYYLEQALKADYCNPLYAIARVDNRSEWAKYRSLFAMHLNLKLIEQYLRLGSKWDKRVAYFFNAPWKRENLESLKTAESCYRSALLYWPEAERLAKEAMRQSYVDLEEVHLWQDEAQRILDGELNYQDIIGDELARLQKVRADFEAMDSYAY